MREGGAGAKGNIASNAICDLPAAVGHNAIHLIIGHEETPRGIRSLRPLRNHSAVITEGRTRSDPRLGGDRAGQLQVCRVAKRDDAVAAIQVESLTDLAGSKPDTAALRAVVAPLNIIRIAVAGPPANHVRWWSNACCGRD